MTTPQATQETTLPPTPPPALPPPTLPTGEPLHDRLDYPAAVQLLGQIASGLLASGHYTSEMLKLGFSDTCYPCRADVIQRLAEDSLLVAEGLSATYIARIRQVNEARSGRETAALHPAPGGGK